MVASTRDPLARAAAMWAAGFGLAAAPALAAPPAPAPAAAHVSVNTAVVRAAVTRLSLGVNTAVWDGRLRDPQVPGLLKQAGMTVLRYPGGSTSDVYHWRTHTDTSGTHFDAGTSFDGFLTVARQAGASPIVVVNYGSNADGTGGGDPAEAAAWVAYAKAHDAGVRYWEIGNEIYGNGFYNNNGWEEDRHDPKAKANKTAQGNPLLSPEAYGRNVLTFVHAMKAADPTARIGVVLTTPGNWPDGQTPDWNRTVLGICGHAVDFAVIHWYPQNPPNESDAGLLASTSRIPDMARRVRALTRELCGKALPVFLTETNSVAFDPGKQSVSLVNALYAADDVPAWLESGIANVDWWALHNGPTLGKNNSPGLYGDATFGDYGFLSNGNSPEPPAETPFPSYYGLRMAHLLAAPGDTLVSATSDQPLLSVHAARRAGGGLAVMLVNKDPKSACTVRVTVTGAPAPAATGVRYEYGPGDTAIRSRPVSGLGRAFTVTIPAYTVIDLVVPAR